jgi:hypothetical protein
MVMWVSTRKPASVADTMEGVVFATTSSAARVFGKGDFLSRFMAHDDTWTNMFY